MATETAVNSKSAARKTKTVRKKAEVVSTLSDDDECVVLSPIVVLKKKCDMKRYDKVEECFILDFDPFEVAVKKAKKIDEDVVMVSEKGQVACRDYPHSRHLCIKFPFDKTPHESYCKLCYCYVCDKAAPCIDWKLAPYAHCNASDKDHGWKRKRELRKKTAKLDPTPNRN